jgi:hypothetical protein
LYKDGKVRVNAHSVQDRLQVILRNNLFNIIAVTHNDLHSNGNEPTPSQSQARVAKEYLQFSNVETCCGRLRNSELFRTNKRFFQAPHVVTAREIHRISK